MAAFLFFYLSNKLFAYHKTFPTFALAYKILTIIYLFCR